MRVWEAMHSGKFVLLVVFLGGALALAGSLIGPHPDGHVVQMWLQDYEKQVGVGEPFRLTLALKSEDTDAKKYEMRVLVDGFEKHSRQLDVPPGYNEFIVIPFGGVPQGKHQVSVLVYDPNLPDRDFGSQQRPYSVSYWLTAT